MSGAFGARQATTQALKKRTPIEVKNLINTKINKQKIAKSEPKTQPNDV